MAAKNDQDGILKPGAVFEKYTVEKLLGRGGMGEVYLVRHNVLDSLFALKVLFPDAAKRNRQFVDRFIREAKLACKIRHPNLITVHDAGQNPDSGMYYIVMDYVPNGSVRDLLKREHRLYPRTALRIITQIAGALTAAYEHHMVHRDIKPDNIMFASDGSAKLADLGIAKSTDEQDTTLTLAPTVFGTPSYMSPEQALDSRKVDSRADIYSLGIVFYEMLAGQRPYRGDSSIQILSQIVSETETPDIRTVCPQIPPVLAELVADMTAKKLSQRIQNPKVLLERLNKIDPDALPGPPHDSAAEAPTAPPANTPPQPKKSSPTRDGKADDAELPEKSDRERAKSAFRMKRRDVPAAEEKTVKMEPAAPATDRRSEKPAKKPLRRKIYLPAAAVLVVAAAVVAGLAVHLAGGKTAAAADARRTTPTNAPATSAGAAGAPKKAPGEAAAPAAQPTNEAVSDPLGQKQIVFLADASESSGGLIAALKREFGSANVSFQLLESMGGYKRQLKAIIKSAPAAVVVDPAGKYAADRLSETSFENILYHHADVFRDSGVPSVFVLAPEAEGDGRRQLFNRAVEKMCQARSIPLIGADRKSGDLIRVVREVMKR